MKRENLNAGNMKLSVILSYITIFINIITGLIYTPWMITKIGQSDYALYILVNSVIAIFLLDLGLSNATSRFTSLYLVERKNDKIPDLMGTIFKVYIGLATIIAIAFFVFYTFIDSVYINLTANELARFKVVYITLACGSIVSFVLIPLEGIMLSYEKFVPINLIKLFQKISTVCLIAFSLIIGWGLYALVGFTIACNLAGVGYKLIYVNKNIHLNINWRIKDISLIKQIFSFSIWITLIQTAQRFFVGIIPTILGIVSGSTAIAIFGIASALESYGFTFARAFVNMYLPKVTRVQLGDNSDSKLLELMVKIGRLQAYIIGLIIIGFILVGKDFIYLWVGSEYNDAYICAVILLIPLILTHTQGIAALAMQVINELKWQAYVYILCAVINIVLGFVLGAEYGAFGASLALMIAQLCNIILIDIVYQRKLGLDIISFFKQCFISMLLPFAITFFIGFLVVFLLPSGNWLWLLIKACFITVIYVISMWFISMNMIEKEIFYGIFRKFQQNSGKARG